MIGPHALGIIQDVEGVRHLAELGVVFLLFNIGLELSLERLRSMQKYVFGMGTSQVRSDRLKRFRPSSNPHVVQTVGCVAMTVSNTHHVRTWYTQGLACRGFGFGVTLDYRSYTSTHSMTTLGVQFEIAWPSPGSPAQQLKCCAPDIHPKP